MMEASIIIPTYNRSGKLHRCLLALSDQTYPMADFEVIVVVDGSTDDTLKMLAELKVPFGMRVIRQPNSGQPAALNRGAAEAIGRICIFLDDDILVAPRFIAEHLRLHDTRERVVGIGQMTLTLPPNADWFARGFARSWIHHYTDLNHGRHQPDWDDCYGGNMSVSRAAFLAVGGNVNDLKRAYDVELAFRLKQYGCSFEYLPEAIGNQYENKGFRELTADSESSGEASAELVRRYPGAEKRLLGNFQKTRRSWMLLWQLLSIINLSGRAMERLYRLGRQSGQSFEWFVFFNHYYFWRGVRRAAPERTGWKQIVLRKRGNLA